MGIIPLYMGWDQNGTFYVASELKALEGICTKIELFPPGHYLYSKDGELKRWYTRDWMDYENVKDNETTITELREALEAAVHRQLMSDVPYGVLLSGGLDSSITSAIAKKYADKRIESDDKDTSLVATVTLLRCWIRRLSRFGSCSKSSRSFRNSTSRNKIHYSRRYRCHYAM